MTTVEARKYVVCSGTVFACGWIRLKKSMNFGFFYRKRCSRVRRKAGGTCLHMVKETQASVKEQKLDQILINESPGLKDVCMSLPHIDGKVPITENEILVMFFWL